MADTGECMQGPGAMLVCAPSQAVASWQVASALLRTLLHQPAMDRMSAPGCHVGLRFFPGYLSDVRRDAVDETALVVQSLGFAELRRLKPGAPPPLLPAPDGSLQPPPLPPAPGALSPGALPPTDQRRSLGAVHICEHTECRLPAERFWESNGGGGKTGGRALRRTQSAPPS